METPVPVPGCQPGPVELRHAVPPADEGLVPVKAVEGGVRLGQFYQQGRKVVLCNGIVEYFLGQFVIPLGPAFRRLRRGGEFHQRG